MNLKFWILGFSFLTLNSSVGVFASENSAELTCRAKAKEIAADTYRDCVNEYKGAEIQRLKKDYQERLRSLKDDYQREVENLGVKTKTAKVQNPRPAVNHRPDSRVNAPNVYDNSNLQDQSQMDLPEPIPVQ